MADEQQQVVPRVRGGVLPLAPWAWEEGFTLVPRNVPLPAREWSAELRRGSYTVSRIPHGILVDGPYAGGVVVAAESEDDGRLYFAVPPEAVDTLAEVLAGDELRRLSDDMHPHGAQHSTGTAPAARPGRFATVAGRARPLRFAPPEEEGEMTAAWWEERGWTAARMQLIDGSRWDQDRVIVPVGPSSTTEDWARTARQEAVQVVQVSAPVLAAGQTWDGYYVVSCDGERGRFCFLAPPAALALVQQFRGGQ